MFKILGFFRQFQQLGAGLYLYFQPCCDSKHRQKASFEYRRFSDVSIGSGVWISTAFFNSETSTIFFFFFEWRLINMALQIFSTNEYVEKNRIMLNTDFACSPIR